jgi:dGTP triphosphohydrolase
MPSGLSYRYHSRATHTFKVSQLAGAIANRLLFSALEADRRGDRSFVSLVEKFGGLSPTVAAAGGLIHDLGHAPFGHLGETVLDAVSERIWGLSLDGNRVLSFEGNAQSFRTVHVLEQNKRDTSGLKLPPAIINAAIKYPWRFSPGLKKYGCYKPHPEDADPREEAGWKLARDYVAELGNRRTLEAQVVDLADDISYAVHDVEDFYRAGLVPLDLLARTVNYNPEIGPPAWLAEMSQAVTRAWRKDSKSLAAHLGVPQLSKDLTFPPEDCAALESSGHRDAVLPALLDLGDPPEVVEVATVLRQYVLGHELPNTFTGDAGELGALRSYSANLINLLLDSVDFSDHVGADFDRNGRIVVAILKWLVEEHVFNDPRLLRDQAGQRLRIEAVARHLASHLGLYVAQPFQSSEETRRIGALMDHAFLSSIPRSGGPGQFTVPSSWPRYFQEFYKTQLNDAPDAQVVEGIDIQTARQGNWSMPDELVELYATEKNYVLSRISRGRLVLDAVAWMGEAEINHLYETVVDQTANFSLAILA